MTHARNLCATVEARPIYALLPCVPRPKPATFFPENRDAEYDRRHAWQDDFCCHCQRSRAEVRIRLNPKTGRTVRPGTLAREIALGADVAPVQFVGAMP